jgi:hypothetical protein
MEMTRTFIAEECTNVSFVMRLALCCGLFLILMYMMKVTIASDRGTSPVINFISCKHHGCLISFSVDLELAAINLMVFIAILLFLFHAIHTLSIGVDIEIILLPTPIHRVSKYLSTRPLLNNSHTHDTTHAFFIQTS